MKGDNLHLRSKPGRAQLARNHGRLAVARFHFFAQGIGDIETEALNIFLSWLVRFAFVMHGLAGPAQPEEY
jgi:hypothetical protein